MPIELKKEEIVPALTILMFFWALIIPLSKMIVEDVSPVLISFLRNVLGALALLFMMWFRKKSFSIEKKDIIPLGFLGICGTALASLFMFIGVELSTATNTSILVNTNPIFVALIAPFLIHEALGKKQLLGIILAFVGMVFVISGGMNLEDMLKSDYFLGNMASIIAALLISIYAIFGKKYIKKYGGISATFYTVLGGAVFMLLYTIATGEITEVGNISLDHWLILLYIGAVVTGFVYALWYKSIRYIGASRASSFKLLIPVFAAIVSVILLAESPDLFTIFGGILVVIGLALSQKQ